MLTSISIPLPRQASALGNSGDWDQSSSPDGDSSLQARGIGLNTPVPRQAPSHRKAAERFGSTTQNPLTALAADEDAIEARKANIRRFGSTWMRPPGVPKTYQAMVDEAVERAEQEAIARREAAMMEQTAAAEAAARTQTQTEVGGRTVEGGIEDGAFGAPGVMDLDVDMDAVDEGLLARRHRRSDEMERDLDEEVPDADDFTFDDGSGIGDGEDEQNLDDDVPEAGSYQHTDTEVEDESSEDASPPRSGPVEDIRRRSGPDLQSESSLLVSSPIAARGPRRNAENVSSRRATPGGR